MSSYWKSLEDRAPIDEICGCPLCKWVAKTWLSYMYQDSIAPAIAVRLLAHSFNCWVISVMDLQYHYPARFLSLVQRKLRLCSTNLRPGYWSNLPCDWPSTAWAYSEQLTENDSRSRSRLLDAAGFNERNYLSPLHRFYWYHEIHYEYSVCP